MLFVLTGSSGAGKTTLAAAVVASVPGLVARDTDEFGVPSNADTAWRQAELEQWIRRAAAYEADGVDLLLSGQSALGEVLAAPSTTRLSGVAVCLVDVSDEVRAQRLHSRQPGVWTDEAVADFNAWGRWHREHAADPQAKPEVLTAEGWQDMCWARWSSWRAGDPRWRTWRLDTTGATVEQARAGVEEWIRAERDLQRRGSHPLSGRWADL